MIKRLWAPWRRQYIEEIGKGMDRGCIFCNAVAENGDKSLLLYVDSHAMVLVNKYPYNPGHLMVAPTRHVGDLLLLSYEEVKSMWNLIKESVRILTRKYRPDGFNIGLNLGRLAGAGIEEHLHVHIVPRWAGDTNFMPVIADTKVISSSLSDIVEDLKREFMQLKLTPNSSQEL